MQPFFRHWGYESNLALCILVVAFGLFYCATLEMRPLKGLLSGGIAVAVDFHRSEVLYRDQANIFSFVPKTYTTYSRHPKWKRKTLLSQRLFTTQLVVVTTHFARRYTVLDLTYYAMLSERLL